MRIIVNREGLTIPEMTEVQLRAYRRAHFALSFIDVRIAMQGTFGYGTHINRREINDRISYELNQEYIDAAHNRQA